MYGSNPFWLVHLVRWVFQKTIEFFSRTVEVFLHYRFGRRYLVGKWGVGALVLQTTVVLLVGVFLRTPFELAMKVLRFDPSAADVRGFVDRSTPDSVDMRGQAAETLDALKNTYVLDDSLGWGSYYGQLFYREAMQAVSLPFVLFLGGFLALGWYHQGVAEQTDEVNDFAGHSHLRTLVPGVRGRFLTSRIEPLLTIAMGLIAWGYLPGSRIHVPFSLDADPVLGHYLLVAGVCLGLKEQLRLSSEKQKEEDQVSRQRKMGRDPSTPAKAGEESLFWPVVVDLDIDACRPTLSDAYDALPPSLHELLSGLPGTMSPVKEECDHASTPHGNAQSEASSPDTAKSFRVACPTCATVYQVASRPAGNPKVRCRRCGESVPFSDLLPAPKETTAALGAGP